MSKANTRSQLSTRVGLLRRGLEAIEEKMIELLDCSTIEAFENDPDSGIVLFRPPYYWGKPDDKQLRLQIELKRTYSDWFEQLELLLSDATHALSREINEANAFVRGWIEKEFSWEISPDLEKNKASFRKQIGVFYKALSTLDDPARAHVVLVPDTNSLIRCPEPVKYAGVAGGSRFDFVLLPTVLGELDELKIKHRDDSFREKVESVIRRIKGWRTQGNLLDGVTVDKTITVRTVARDPDFQKTLHWLDKTNRDDKIVASVLELGRDMPSAAIVLVTGDINLQNKAAAACVPYAEPPAAKAATPKRW